MAATAFIIDAVNVHRWVMHLPLAMLVIAPLFAAGAMFTRSVARRTLSVSGMLLMMLGVVLVHVTFVAGQRAAGAVLEAAQRAVLNKHAEFAELAIESFTLAALLLALSLLLSRLLHLHMTQVTAVLPIGAVLFYVLGLLWLTDAAYYGEILSHRSGVSN